MVALRHAELAGGTEGHVGDVLQGEHAEQGRDDLHGEFARPKSDELQIDLAKPKGDEQAGVTSTSAGSGA